MQAGWIFRMRCQMPYRQRLQFWFITPVLVSVSTQMILLPTPDAKRGYLGTAIRLLLGVFPPGASTSTTTMSAAASAVCRVSGSSRYLALGDLVLLALAPWFLALGSLVCVGVRLVLRVGVLVRVVCLLCVGVPDLYDPGLSGFSPPQPIFCPLAGRVSSRFAYPVGIFEALCEMVCVGVR